jgi:RNA polymerase sigma-70 factor (ECF subfamily)
MKADAQFSTLVLATLPELRAFAMSLTHDGVRADDLVQETVLRAWSCADQFQAGTCIKAWLFTILHNLFYTDHRRRKREVDDPQGIRAARLKTCPEQQSRLDLEDMQAALAKLAPLHREVLILVGAEGLSYDEAAAICGVSVGTIKSRVNRARLHLARLLHIEAGHEFGPDNVVKGVVETDRMG